MKISRRTLLIGSLAVPATGAAAWMLRDSSSRAPSEVTFSIQDGKRRVIANGMPGHATGDFPNAHDPLPIRPQRHRFEMSARPVAADRPRGLDMWLFGVAVNGVPFDPSGPFWNGDPGSGWQFEVLYPHNAVALGIDINHAHTQEGGMYHYHGLPRGLMTAGSSDLMQLLGFAADGFPIYGPECLGDPGNLKSKTRRLRSSYRLRAGRREGGPPGRFDGSFVEDFEYVEGSGDLDECNGRAGPTPEFPDGTYYYVLTDEFPFIPRFFRGTPDPTFRHGPPPGTSAPLPPELKAYPLVPGRSG